MSVDAVRFQNFMAFEDTDWVELRPITLLFGRNSSGKSALIRGLLLLRQSLQPPNDGQVIVFSTPYGIDVGGFREMVHGAKEESIVRFHFRCTRIELENLLAASHIPGLQERATPTLQLALGYAAPKEGETLRLDRVELTDLELHTISTEGEDGDLLFRAVLLNPEDEALFGDRWFVDGILPGSDEPGVWRGFGCNAKRGFLDISFVRPQPNVNVDVVPMPSEAPEGYHLLETVFKELQTEIRGFLNQIVHLGPIRPEPQRRYSFSQTSAHEWRARDWTAFLDFIDGELGQVQREEVNTWLQKLELASESETRQASEFGSLFTEFEVAIRETNEARPRPVSAMGFGLSQVLPVIVQCVAAQPGGLVIVEQPELHLHPRAQAELGDLFIAKALKPKKPDEDTRTKDADTAQQHHGDALKPRKADEDSRTPRFLLETHSEHLILRLMRRMRNTARGELPSGIPATNPTNVGVYVANRDPERLLSQLHGMEISPEGQLLEPWPGGFFEEDFLEQFA